MIQLTHAGLVCAASEADLNRLRAEFDHEHSVVLPALLEPALLRRALHEIEGATFEEHVDDGIGSELRMRDNRASHLLDFLVNDPGLFALIERIAGCGRVGSFIGRVYRALPNSSHFDNWHDDLVDERLIGMSMNLSPKAFAGSLLRIRHESGLIVREIANVGLGDAVIFRLSPQLQHRVTPLEGSVAKTAFAGWFRARPDLLGDFRACCDCPNRGSAHIMSRRADGPRRPHSERGRPMIDHVFRRPLRAVVSGESRSWC